MRSPMPALACAVNPAHGRQPRWSLPDHLQTNDEQPSDGCREIPVMRLVDTAVNPWWAMLPWGLLGAVVGVALCQPTQALLTVRRQDHRLINAVTLGLLTAVLFGLLAWRVGVRPELVAYSGLATVCVPLSAIDVIEKRMPSRLLVPAYPGLIVLFGIAAAVEHNAAALLRSLAGMAILFTFYLIIGLASRGALGAADIRLAGLLGLALAWPGWDIFVSGAALGLLYGGFTGAAMIVLRRASRHTLIPLGPALIVGAFTALLVPIA
jgi:leader peptidase (prepilin peptidase) / N-methyltransferase